MVIVCQGDPSSIPAELIIEGSELEKLIKKFFADTLLILHKQALPNITF